MKSRRRRIIIGLIKFAIAVVIVLWAWHKKIIDPEQIIAQLRGADVSYIIYGLLLMQIAVLIGWVRWCIIVRAEGFNFGLHDAFAITMIGSFFNMFLMGAIGGDLMKAYYIATGEGREKKAEAITTVFMDRIFGGIGLFALLFAALIFSGGGGFASEALDNFIGPILTTFAVIMLAFAYHLIPYFRRQRKRKLEQCIKTGSRFTKIWKALYSVDEALTIVTRAPRVSFWAFVLSVLGHLPSIFAFMLFAHAMGYGDNLSLSAFTLLVPMAIAICALPIFPAGGLGVGETAAAAVFASVGMPCGAVMLLLWRLARYVTAPIGLVYFVIYRERIGELQIDE